MNTTKTHQQLLDAAEQIIREKGVARATTKEIAKLAGVAEGTLYKHFERKEDLFLTLFRQRVPAEYKDAISEQQSGTGSVSANLTAIALAGMRHFEQIMPLMVAFFADTDSLVRLQAFLQDTGSGPQRLYADVAAYLEAEQRCGRINRQESPLSGAALLLGPCWQWVFMRQFLGTNPVAVSEEQFVNDLVQGLMSGLAPEREVTAEKRRHEA
jgi:AcrR family transcriptional regulator